MEINQIVKIDGRQYIIQDAIQNLRIEDSFIAPKNKLAAYDGSGEARKYVGSYSGGNKEQIENFFEYNKWGNVVRNGKRTYPVFQDNCFFSQSNLKKYLENARLEYLNQEQVYHKDISQYYKSRKEQVNKLESEIIRFSIYDVSDLKKSNSNRAYVRSDDSVWKLFRSLVLPKISYLSILKIKSLSKYSTPIFYFRVFLDYQFRSIVHPKLATLDDLSKDNLSIGKSTTREGAAEYRRKVIDHMPQCPFTKISDERLLIASHIKPYQVCVNENKLTQAVDFYNGLALSPTYDKLFDQGFITFLNNGQLVCGTQLTPYTWSKLKINPSSKNLMRIYPDSRNEYLKYHRINVFQDDIDQVLLD